jgi:hypothetical protein
VRSSVIAYLGDKLAEEIETHSVVEDCAESTLLEELNTLRQDMAALKRQNVRFSWLIINNGLTIYYQNNSWLTSAVFSTYTSCKKYFRRSPRLGTQRFEWICVRKTSAKDSTKLTS